LVFLERVPAFAAVNDAVTLARSGARGAAEYTNAVLRAFAKRGAREREPAPPRDPTDALATRCSFPTWLAARWVTRYGAAEAEALMRAMNERPPLTLRANTLRLSREALAARQAARLGRVTEASARLGVTIVQTIEGTAQELASSYAPRADALLVDAPCTSLGVLRRNPEVKWRRRPEDIAASAARQREILTAAATLVKPGGRLVYATCSPEPEENEAVVTALLTAQPAWRLDPPADFPLSLDADGYLRTRPDRHGIDGFTAVRLRRA